MKMYLISDNVDTYTGMRLAGVDGVVVHEKQELRDALETAMNDKSIGIILLTERFGREFPDLIDEIKLKRKMPLLIEIPDRHGTGRKKDFITSYVNEAPKGIPQGFQRSMCNRWISGISYTGRRTGRS